MLNLLHKAQGVGIRVNRYRLFHSKGLTDKKVDSKVKEYRENGEFLKEKEIIEKFLIEKTEKELTKRLIILYIAHAITILNSLLFIALIPLYNIQIFSFEPLNLILYGNYLIVLLFFWFDKNLNTNVLMLNMSIDLSNSVYDNELEQQKSVK